MLSRNLFATGASFALGATLLAGAAVPAHADGQVPASGCTFTQGWYKNHADQWAWAAEQMPIFGNSGQSMLQVLQADSKQGVYYQLGQQFIAATLNQRMAPMSGSVSSAYGQAAAYFAAASPTDPLTKDQAAALKALIPVLDAYNQGTSPNGPGHCGSGVTYPSEPYLPGGLYS